MKGIILEDFLDFNLQIEEFLNHTQLAEEIDNFQFHIFGEDFSDIIYTFDYKESCSFELKEILEMMVDSEVICKTNYLELKKVREVMDHHHGQIYLLKIINPVGEKDNVCATVLFCSHKEFKKEDLEIFNEHYLFHVIYNIQLISNNYSRIYNLIDIFSNIIMVKDKYMPYHMTNVANICIKIGSVLNLSSKEITVLYFSALLHDIGKLYIGDSIINKPAKLDEYEFSLIKRHAEKGSEIITSVLYGTTLLHEIPTIVRYHHENYNGSGYPNGLSGKGIPYLSRVIRVADTIDAMASKRVYRTSQDLELIVKELVQGSGILYDPVIADAAIQVLLEKKASIPEEHLSSTMFIPQASLNYISAYNNKNCSISGNLIIKNKKGEFLVNENKNQLFLINNMKRTTIGFMEQQEFLEYSIKVNKFNAGKLYIDNIKWIPFDKTFSLKWNSEIKIVDLGGKIQYSGILLRLGGEVCQVQFSAEDSIKIKSNIDCIYKIFLNESIESIELNLRLNAKIVNFYQFDDESLFIFWFHDIVPSQKDKIIRLLFKKQAEMRKKTNYINAEVVL